MENLAIEKFQKVKPFLLRNIQDLCIFMNLSEFQNNLNILENTDPNFKKKNSKKKKENNNCK
jgi:hypothetical protein